MSLINKKVTIISLGIFIFSLMLRGWYGIEHVAFGQDQGRDLLIMERFIKENKLFIGYGPKASVGDFYMPPFYYQLHYLVAQITRNAPLAMQWLITIVESFTPVVLYWWLREILDEQAALVGALFYSISSMAITFATMMWNPNMIPFFTTLFAFSMFKLTIKNEVKYIPIGILTAAISIHLHYQSVVILSFLVIVVFWSLIAKKSSIKPWVFGFILAMLTLTPYVRSEINNNFVNTREIINYFTQEHKVMYERVSKPDYLHSFIPSFIERVLVGGNRKYIWLGRSLFGLGVIGLVFMSSKRKDRKSLWLLIYLVSILASLRIYKGDKIDYYMSMLYVLPAILLAVLYRFSSKYKFYLMPFFILISFWAGNNYGKVTQPNDLKALREAVNYIGEETNYNEIAVIIQNPEMINTFKYGFYENDRIQVSNKSEYLVDICEVNRACLWDGLSQSIHGSEYSRSAWIKSNNEYQLIGANNFGKFRVVVGRFN